MPVDAYSRNNGWPRFIVVAEKRKAGNDRYDDEPRENVQTMETCKGKKARSKYAAADADVIIQQA